MAGGDLKGIPLPLVEPQSQVSSRPCGLITGTPVTVGSGCLLCSVIKSSQKGAEMRASGQAPGPG